MGRQNTDTDTLLAMARPTLFLFLCIFSDVMALSFKRKQRGGCPFLGSCGSGSSEEIGAQAKSSRLFFVFHGPRNIQNTESDGARWSERREGKEWNETDIGYRGDNHAHISFPTTYCNTPSETHLFIFIIRC